MLQTFPFNEMKQTTFTMYYSTFIKYKHHKKLCKINTQKSWWSKNVHKHKVWEILIHINVYTAIVLFEQSNALTVYLQVISGHWPFITFRPRLLGLIDGTTFFFFLPFEGYFCKKNGNVKCNFALNEVQ
jgi:hypothetical protein